MAEELELPALDEATKVRTWRELRALEYGCSPGWAAIFTLSGAGVHELEDLITRGCPPDVAADILSD